MVTTVEIPLLDITVTPMTASEVVDAVDDAVSHRRPMLMGGHNLHSVYVNQVSDAFRRFAARCDVTLVDGFPILLATRGRMPRWRTEYRVGSTDWIPGLVNALSVRRIAVVGSTRASNAGAVARLRDLSSDWEVTGWPGEAWTAERALAVVDGLWEFAPDVVLVGLGMPLQESFVDENLESMPPAVYATVGGAIDQLAGIQRNAPRWLGRVGLEWLWRLASQPRRLGHRYLVEPMLLAWLLAIRAIRRARPASVRAGSGAA